ncbi:uncharacterized protein [Nicotiana tomentosiformis]|uniref:uncharacterized protein n=1 Tax=Nicotiana tomentosiformis TaxID=4098 RepID=UPI00388C3D77
MEDLMKAFINKSDKKFKTQGTTIREQGTAIRNLERQFRHIANLLSERAPRTLPSDTEKNPKETIKVVSLRSGKTLVDPVVLTQMPSYAKFLKEIQYRKRKLEEITMVKLNAHYSAILQNKIPQNKLKGELGVIKLIPLSLQLVDQTTILLEGIIEDILVWVENIVFPVDFIVVDMEVNKEVPLILGRAFLCTDRVILDIYEGQLMLRVGNEKVVFQMKRMMKYPSDETSTYSCFKINVVGELDEKYKFDKLVGNTLERCITQSSKVEDEDPEIKKVAEALETEDQVGDEEKLKEEASKPSVELKILPIHLKYAFLETNNFPMIISAYLTGT